MIDSKEVKQILNTFNDSVFLLDEAGSILLINDKATTEFNLDFSRLPLNLDDLISLTGLISNNPVNWRKFTELNNNEASKVICHGGKRAFIGEIVVKKLLLDNFDWVVSIRDITQREQLESSLFKSKQELHLLYSMLIEAQETERQRIATELHDQIGQMLVRLKLDLQWIHRHLKDKEKDQLQNRVNISMSILNETVRQVKQMTHTLKPQLLQQLGLHAGVMGLIEYFKDDSGIEVKTRIKITNLDLDKDKALDVYRIVQQGITNAIEHGNPSIIEVNLSTEKNELLIVEIVDNGIGFDYDESIPTGLGIAGMQERVYRWGGIITISSYNDAGKSGTRLRAEIPL